LLASSESRAAGPDVHLETSVDVRAIELRRMPAMVLQSPYDTSTRTLPSGALASTGPQTLVGVTYDAGIAIGRRWSVPLFGIEFAWAVGSSPEVITGLDGSIVHLQTWTSKMATLLLPGFGVRAVRRRWMFELSARGVLSVAWMTATVADAGSSLDLSDQNDSVLAVTFGARADAEVCRRLDPIERACLFVSPALYEFSAFNGGSIGLRWEVGP
jgi:hypothetical protein